MAKAKKATDAAGPATDSQGPNPSTSGEGVDESLSDNDKTRLEELTSYEGFLARPSLKNDLHWLSIPNRGRLLVNQKQNPVNLVALFKVTADNYFVGPCGGTFELRNAKYRFVGGPPTTPWMKKVYDDAVKALKDFANEATKNAPYRNLFHVDDDGNISGVNFSLPCFVQRPKPFKASDTTFLETLKASPSMIDDDPDCPVHLSRYPMTRDQRNAYAEIHEDYAFDVLPVYKGTDYVEPGDVTDSLWNSTVRVHFRLINHYFRDKQYHSIKAEIESVSIIEESPSGPPSPSKKRSLDGPLTPEKERAAGKKVRWG